MTPVLQNAMVGLIWALSVSLVIFVSSLCTQWYMRIVDDRNAVEVEEFKDKMKAGGVPLHVAYLCDCAKECHGSERCSANGGDCCRTTDIRHAARFQYLGVEDYYMEKSPGEEVEDEVA